MDDKEIYYIPRYLDEPERWLFWTIDEACILVIPVIIGISLSYFILGIILSLTSYISWIKLKRAGHISTIRFALYWFYPDIIMRLKATPSSHLRFYIG